MTQPTFPDVMIDEARSLLEELKVPYSIEALRIVVDALMTAYKSGNVNATNIATRIILEKGPK